MTWKSIVCQEINCVRENLSMMMNVAPRPFLRRNPRIHIHQIPLDLVLLNKIVLISLYIEKCREI